MTAPTGEPHAGGSASEGAPARTVSAGAWQRFRQRHLFDYNPAATRWWLTLGCAGFAALVWALAELAGQPAATQLHVGLGLLVIAAAACFPVRIPRSKYSHSVADIFVFTLLAQYGAAAATLAAAVEALVGVTRSSKRLSSRIGTPAVAGAGMALCGPAFELLHRTIADVAASPAPATLAALCMVAVPYFACTTLPLLALMAVKNGRRLSLREWAGEYSWLAAVYLLSAAVAGVLAMNASQFGPLVIAIAVVVAATVLALIQFSLRRHEAERRHQETRIADAEREAALNQQRFAAAFTHAAIGMALVRPDGRIHQVNRALCTLLGRDEPELLGLGFTELLHPGDAALFARHGDAHGEAGGGWSIELRARRRDGAELWVSLHRSRFTDPAHEGEEATIYQLHDITSRRQAEGELQHIAFHDGLTDLANRNCFNERLAVAVERSRIDPGQRFAVMFLDLDRFKVVNDSLGHIAGNQLLREVARRLGASVRPSDLVARLGGDEFAVLIEQLDDPADALALAQRLLDALAAPTTINGTEVLPQASIGITFSDLGYRTTDEVLRDADIAMYAAKAAEDRHVALFDVGMHERIADKMRLEGDLRRAIGEGQLTLAFQPLFELEPYALEGFEALVRWVHPERGPISPAVFVALAEESGHIGALTAWVIDEAVGQLVRWHHQCHAAQDLGVHVNISGRDLADHTLAARVYETLSRHGLAGRHLTLEITETTLMGRLADALETLNALRRLGVKFSIDDFGTGYSSLAYLSTLPIDSLKIDRSFVAGMHEKPQNVEIVRTVLSLGRNLGKKIIAEGVETPAQLATLRSIGVDVGQGYLLSPPLRANEVPALFAPLEAAPALAAR